MTEIAVNPIKLADALAAAMTCSGGDRRDVDTYSVARLKIWADSGILIETTDRQSAAQSFVATKSDSRPTTAPDLEVTMVDAAQRVAGLIKHAAKSDAVVTIKMGEETAPFGSRDVVEFLIEDAEKIKATTLGVAMNELDAVFDNFEPGCPDGTQLSQRQAERVAKITKATGPIDLAFAEAGAALITPVEDPGFEFRAIVSVAGARS